MCRILVACTVQGCSMSVQFPFVTETSFYSEGNVELLSSSEKNKANKELHSSRYDLLFLFFVCFETRCYRVAMDSL